tara:strand:+ start:101 stop:1063 length:963 start_codon:yes stop_codon:yes gene_type:complete
MKLRLIDHPIKIAVEQYGNLKNKLVNQLLAHNSVLSVYQMGSVKEPGISDLDIICVFKNDSDCMLNLRKELSNDEKKVLTHGIFGLEERDLKQAISFNLLSNLKFLGGKNLNLNKNEVIFNQDLRDQIALEYMMKMFITLDAQTKLGIVKLRSFLLLGKAIMFDLELLGIKNGNIFDFVNKVLYYRTIWYDDKPQEKKIEELILNFYVALEEILIKTLEEKQFFLPYNEINLPGGFKILKGELFQKNHKGLVLPSMFQFLGKKYINLQYRLNKFTYRVPYKLPNNDTFLFDRFKFSEQMVIKNRKSFPYFIQVTSSLSIY